MENMLKEKINKSELSNSDKYLHVVRLNANDDSTYEVFGEKVQKIFKILKRIH